MSNTRSLTIELDGDLAEKLANAAAESGLAPERIAADCVAHHYELSTRFLALMEKFEKIDNNLAVIAHFVAEATGPAESVDLWKICRYRRETESR